MNDRIARGLSWGTTLLCVHYILWGGYHVFRSQVPGTAQLYAGIGTELPASTRFIIGVSNFYFWPAATLLALLVIGKEILVRDIVIRLAITFVVLFFAAWFFEFAISSMIEPVVNILDRAR